MIRMEERSKMCGAWRKGQYTDLNCGNAKNVRQIGKRPISCGALKEGKK